MPHIRFNWVDILFITLLIRVCYIGFKNGILPEFFRFLGLLFAFIISFNNYTILSRYLLTYTKYPGQDIDIISFVFLFLFVLFIFKIFALAAWLLFRSENISLPNRLIGIALSLGRGVLLISLIYTLLVNAPFKYLSKSAEDKSFSSQYIADVAPFTYKICINFYPWEKVRTPLVRLLER